MDEISKYRVAAATVNETAPLQLEMGCSCHTKKAQEHKVND